MYENNWIAEAEGTTSLRSFDGDERLTFEDGPFKGTLARYLVRPGLALYSVAGRTTHAFRLTTDGVAPPGHLVLGTMLGGAGVLQAEGNADLAWSGGRRSFAVSLAEREISYHLPRDREWSAVSLLVEPETLEELASGDGLPPLARAVLDDGRLPVSHLYDPKRGVARIATEILSHPYQGGMRALWRESKSLEYLCGLLDCLEEGGSAESAALSPSEVRRLKAAHALLVKDLRLPGGLAELAREVGLSQRRLSQGFRRLYGLTAFDLILDERMKAARDLVRERPDVPLKTIAWNVGYGQLSNFISAYRRRYGVSPGQDRRFAPATGED